VGSLSRRSLVSRALALSAPLLAALAFASASPPQAHALTFNWNCNYGIFAYGGCYSGSFHSWQTVIASFAAPLPGGYNGFCVKAVTQAGTQKSGGTCFPAFDYFDGITIAPSPISEGYFYFGGSGSSTNNGGSEGT
jgi:hypothetical protein